MKGKQVWSLVQEDPTCHGATKLKCRNYWAHTLQQEKLLQWEVCAMQLESSPCSLQLEKACLQQQVPGQEKKDFLVSQIDKQYHMI